MNHVPEGAVCGIDGCSTPSATAGRQSQEETGPVQQLAIVSDVICPWCYVAKKNLEKAATLSGTNLQVTGCRMN